MQNLNVNLLLLLCCITLSNLGHTEAVLKFSQHDYRDRYYQLLEELRCLVCQNQNLADSNAGLAEDLKQEVFDLIEAGKSNTEIKAFLTLRYGDFILYKPPFIWRTLFLWLGPFILLLATLWYLFLHIKKRQSVDDKHQALTQTEQATLDKLLAKDNPSDK